MTTEIKEALKTICESVSFDEPLSQHTSIRVGGPADALVSPKTIDELQNLLAWSRKNRLPVFVLGAGSNILVRDKGLRGLVISLSRSFGQIRLENDGKDNVELYVEAGVGLPRLVDYTKEEGLTGAEVLSGIPGNLGGALMMNAGTKDGDISQLVLSVTFLDKEGKLKTWSKEEITYSYRESHFPKGAVLLSARLKFAKRSSELIQGKIQEYREYRLETQPLNVPSLGSVFKNPEKKFAGNLIEETGLKNVRVGGARISPKHGNWIVNEGGATAKDVLALIGLVRDKVKEKFGVLLETEVRVVGEE